MSYDSLRLQGFIRDKALIGPKNLTIHLTSRCNYACFYCTHHSKLIPKEHRAGKFDLDFDIFKKIIDDAKELKVDHIVFSGRGEPFMHHNIYEMINYVKDREFNLTILTNGTFKKKEIRTLSRIDALKINLNSLDEDIYKKTQLGTSKNFETVLKNILFLAKLKQVQKRPKVTLLFLLNRHNINEIPDVIAFSKERKIDFINFFLPHVQPEMKDFVLTPKGINDLRKNCTTILKKKDSYLTHTNLQFLADKISSVTLEPELKPRYDIVYYKQELGENFQCAAGWYYLVIGRDGNVYPCCLYNEVFSVGNIFKNRLKEIWFSKEFNAIRHKMKYEHDMNDPFWKRCNNCNWTPHLSAILKEAKKVKKSTLVKVN